MVLVAKPKRSTAIQHKKRSGQHHRHSKHYVKPYWPYLPLMVIAGVGIIINNTWSDNMHGVLGASTNISATQLLLDTNIQRSTLKEAPLLLNNQLTKAAQVKANDMATKNFWSHNTPNGRTPWSFINATGYQFAAAGENLAYGFTSSNAVMNGWMNSTEHRINILNNVFTQVGFGIAQSSNFQNHGPETIVVAEYAEPASLVTATGTNGSVSPLPATVVSTPQASKVSRLQTFNSSASWLIFVVSVATALSISWFILRHGHLFHRVFIKGEAFIIKHPVLDISVVAVGTIGIILTRTAGYIH